MRQLIELSRLPEKDLLPGASWDYGVDLTWLKGMKKDWLESFDWRDVEEELNQWPHFHVDIEGVAIHYIYEKSEDPNAIPLILTHGWPGSFYEFHKIIAPLAHPPPGQQAFHVVVPSLPGYGFSSAPLRQGWTLIDSARCFDHLMSGVLGYPRYAAQGGDWGAILTSYLGTSTYPSCQAIHLTMRTAQTPIPTMLGGALSYVLPTSLRDRFASWMWSTEELSNFKKIKEYMLQGSGYFAEQATRPFTIGLAIQDSPIGLLAWIGEKYHEWSDPEVFPTPEFRHDILATISLYFFTRTLPTSALTYKEDILHIIKPLPPVTKPFGLSQFQHDAVVLPPRWIKKQNQVHYYNSHKQGGHFAALDNPDGLVHDLREFFESQKQVFE